MSATHLSLLGPFMADSGLRAELERKQFDLELSVILWLYLIALSLRLPTWKEGGKELLWAVCKPWQRCIKEILVGNELVNCSVLLTSSLYMDCSLSGSSVYGTSQKRILEWAAISSSRGYSQLRNRTCIS